MATKNIVPRATGEGSLGTADKKWAGVYANEVTVNGTALTSKLASVDSIIGGKVDTSTYNTKMTSLDSSISELSSGKANDNEVLHLSGGTMTGTLTTSDYVIMPTKTELESARIIFRQGDYRANIDLREGKLRFYNGDALDGTSATVQATFEGVVNSGNDYIRYQSGIQIVFGRISYTANTSPVKWAYTFPKEFVNANVIVNVTMVAGNSCTQKGGIEAIGKTSCGGYWSNTAGSVSGYIHIVAIGRWK